MVVDTAGAEQSADTTPRPAGSRRYLLALLVAFILVMIAGVALAFAYYNGQATLLRGQAQANLASIGRLKTDEISRWRRTAMSQAEYMNVRRIGRTDIPLWLDGSDPAAPQRVRQLLEDNAKYRGFQRLLVYDPVSGQSLSSDGTSATAHDVAAAVATVETSAVAIGEPYEAGSGIYLDVTTPMDITPAIRVGLLMRIDLRDFLYPLIQSWPVPSTTAETLLVRRDGDEVLYLNDLRFRKDAALKFRYPMSDSGLLAVQAVAGKTGVVTGKDYRGQRVLGALTPIPGSSWFLVAKMDEAEAYAPVAQAAGVTVAGVVALLLIAAAGLIAAWRIQVAGALRDRAALAERYAFLSRNASDAVLLIDSALHVAEVNDRAVEMYGYARAELVGMSLADLRAPASRAALEEDYRRLREGDGLTLFETVHVRKDGTIIPVEVSARLQVIDGKSSYVAIERDISERRAAEEARREVEQKYQYVFDHSMVAKSITKPSGEIDVNDAFLALVGYTREALGEHGTWQQLTHPDDIAPTEAIIARMLSGELDSARFEKRYVHKDGSVIWTDLSTNLRRDQSGEPGYFMTTILDITARKAVEEELEAYRQHLEALVQDRTEELHAANEELVSANEELTSLNEEMVATNEELASVNEELQNTGEELTSVNEELTATNEELASVNEELQVTNDELVAATMAKSEFLANMSHELRTPLNSIIGFAGVMLQGLTGDLTEEQRNQLTMIRRSGDRLLALISDVLDLSRIESGRAVVNPVSIRIDDLVASAMETVRPLADDHGLRLEMKGPPSGLDIRSDEQKVHQVLVNLLANAVKFTDQGSVTLQIDGPSDSTVVFKVSDTGVGIAPEDLAEIFDEFTQIRHEGAKPEGTGLGLAISRRLAGMLGGSLTATSVVGTGSTFTLVLPRVYRGPFEAGPA